MVGVYQHAYARRKQGLEVAIAVVANRLLRLAWASDTDQAKQNRERRSSMEEANWAGYFCRTSAVDRVARMAGCAASPV